MNARWFRDIYRDAVWESEELTATEKAVAETYARHVRDERDEKSSTADLAWLTYPRIMAKAGIGRRANVSAAVTGLVDAGWLVVVRETSRRPTLYRLAVPSQPRSSEGGTTEGDDGRSSEGGTTVVPKIASGSSASASGSSDGGTQPLRPLEKQPLTSSPLPPVDTSEPSSTSTQEEGDGVDFDQEKRTTNLVDTIRQLRPHWSKKKITEAIAASLDDGRPFDLIERVFPTLAADPATDYPGRLPKDGPWWNIDQQERTGERPPWCGQCDEIVRQVQVESQYGGGMVFTRCPRCHPMNQSPARVNGEYGRHTKSWQRRRDRAMSTPERRLTQAPDVAAELDAAPIYHPDHPRRLINSHADQDRYDEDL